MTLKKAYYYFFVILSSAAFIYSQDIKKNKYGLNVVDDIKI